MLVIGVTDNPAGRADFETFFAEQFEAHGMQAGTSLDLLGDTEITRESVHAALEGETYDSVFLSRLVGVETRTEYVPRMASNDPFGAYGSSYIGQVERREWIEYNVVFVESGLYSVENETPVWTAGSELMDPPDRAAALSQFADAVFAELNGHGFIP